MKAHPTFYFGPGSNLSHVANALKGAAMVVALAAPAACASDLADGEGAGTVDSPIQACTTPTKDRVGNSLQQVFDALFRAETGTGFQRVNKGSLPAVMATKTWVTPVDVPTSSWRAFGVISTPLEQKNGGHEGVDIDVGRNTPVKAAAAGRIVYRLNSCEEGDRWCGNGWGNHVVIDHGDNVFTRYAHLTKANGAVDTQVAVGAVIGLSGSTGLSDGPHLHFELGLHGGQFDSCMAPQNFWSDVIGTKGGVYDARLLAFGQRVHK